MSYRATEQSQRQRKSSNFQVAIMGLSGILMVLIGTDFYDIMIGKFPGIGLVRVLTLVPILVIVLLHFRHLVRGFLAAPELSALVLLAALSYFWSINASNTLERSIPLLITTSLALTLGSLLSLRQLILLFAFVGAINATISILAIATLPAARGIGGSWEGTWNGIFNHKNELGAASMAALLFSTTAATLTRGIWRHVHIFFAFTALFLLIGSESRSAQFIAIVSMAALLIGLRLQHRALIWAICYLLCIILLFVVSTIMLSTGIADPIFDAIGRKPTLSNRIPLWGIVWPYVVDQFWLGYGYLAFWNPTSPYVAKISASPILRFEPFYSHNGVFEVWLHVGFAGIVLLAMTLIRFFVSIFLCLGRVADRTTLIALMVAVLMYILHNVTESNLIGRQSASWMTLTALIIRANIMAKSAKRESRQAPVRRPIPGFRQRVRLRA